MTHEEKKKLILSKIEAGDTRSYNEIQADLELELWKEKMSGFNAAEQILNALKGK